MQAEVARARDRTPQPAPPEDEDDVVEPVLRLKAQQKRRVAVLFEDDGRPLPNLARVMLAMSSVELGTLRASSGLVAGAVLRAALRARPMAESNRIETPPI